MRDLLIGAAIGVGLTLLGGKVFLDHDNRPEAAPEAKLNIQPIALPNDSKMISDTRQVSQECRDSTAASPEQRTKRISRKVLSEENAETGDLKAGIHQLLDSYSEKDLEFIAHYLKTLKAKSPAEQFDIEPVDESWAFQQQASLEYTFFAESPLRDLGQLEEVVCRSQFCRVIVSVPASVELKPSHTLDWATPVSVMFNQDQTDKEINLVEIYIQRK